MKRGAHDATIHQQRYEPTEKKHEMKKRHKPKKEHGWFIRSLDLLNVRASFNFGYMSLGRSSALVHAAPQAHLGVGLI